MFTYWGATRTYIPTIANSSLIVLEEYVFMPKNTHLDTIGACFTYKKVLKTKYKLSFENMTRFSVELSPREYPLCNKTFCNVSCGNGYCDGESLRTVHYY